MTLDTVSFRLRHSVGQSDYGEIIYSKDTNMLFQIDATGALILNLMNENREAGRTRSPASLPCPQWAKPNA